MHFNYRKLVSIAISLSLCAAISSHAASDTSTLVPAAKGVRVVKTAPLKTVKPLRALAATPPDPRAPSAVRSFQDRQLIIPKTRRTAAPVKNPAPVRDTAMAQNAPVAAAMPATVANFEGIGNISGVLPPDTQGDVGWDPDTGKKYYVQWVNLAYQIWDVTTPANPVSLVGPAAGNTLWAGTGSLCASHNDGDPLTRFDNLSNRWVMSQFALSFPNDFHQCIAVSATADPTGEWYLYDFQTSTTLMNDYGKMGVWPDGYYMSFNQFNGSSNAWAGAGVAVFERERMLLGQTARMIYIDTGQVTLNYGGILPSDMDGSPPPAGTPNYFMEWDDKNWLGDTTDTLRIWEFKTDWSDTARSTFGLNENYDPNYKVSTRDVDPDMCSGSRNCIKQPGTAQGLDAISDRLMYRLQYRNFGTHQTLVGNHTVDADNTDHAGIHWFELRKTESGFAMHQEGIHAPDGESRWMGSAAMDVAGNIALGYSVSSSTISPSIRYTGRLTDDPSGTLPQGESSLVAGTGSQTSSSARWGDYSMLAVDPSDGCTFWYTQEYMQTTGSSNWQTRVGSFRFPSCTTAPTGRISGTVTDTSATPLAGALISISGGYSTITDALGHYSIPLVSGNYDVTASKYGYISVTSVGVSVTPPDTATRNFTLADAPRSTISGTVRDAATAWPLYARIDIAGYPGGPVFTDPVTGTYQVPLVEGAYTFTVKAMSGGYDTISRAMATSSGSSKDFGLTATALTCSAPGYARNGISLLSESFETWPLTGWTVTDNVPGGLLWNANTSYNFTNVTGGSGLAATVNSDMNPGVPYDTELRSPLITPPAAQNVILTYRANYQDFSPYDFLDLDISTTGGTTWTNLSSWTSNHGTEGGPGETVNVDLTGYSSGAFMLRWHYYSTQVTTQQTPWDWYAQIDDVSVAAGACTPLEPGGLVIGAVTDANTGAVVSDAVVRDAGLAPATYIDASSDPGHPARMYVIGQPAGVRPLTATASRYAPATVSPVVVAGQTVAQDILLPAGRLAALPLSLTYNLTTDSPTGSQPLTLANSGGATAAYETYSFPGIYVAAMPHGPFASNTRHLGPKNLNDMDASALRVDLTPTSVPPLAAGNVTYSFTTGLQFPWGIGFNYDTYDLWVGNIAIGGGDDLDYRFTTTGVSTADTIDTSAWATVYAADMTYNPLTKTLWQVNVGGNNCIYELDPVAKVTTGRTICPPFGSSQRGLAFDPLTNTYYSGSWNDFIISHFTPEGTMLDSASVGLAVSGLAFNPSTGHLFVMTNAATASDATKFDVYVLDTGAAYANLGGFNFKSAGTNVFADRKQGGLEIDCSGNLWAVDQGAKKVHVAPSGETGVCAWQQTSWLTVAPPSGTVASGATEPLAATVSAAGLAAGIYNATVRVINDSPYGPLFVPVTLNLTELNRLTVTTGGTGSGTVTSSPAGIDCGSTCSATYLPAVEVTLQGIPAPGSTFTEWGGDPDCTDGTVTMNAPKSCTATFNLIPPFNVTSGTVQEAYNAVTDNGFILLPAATEFEEDVLCSRAVTAFIRGGYDNNFTAADGMTTIHGSLKIRNGKVSVSRLRLRE